MLRLEAYAELMPIPNCLGAKHSSLSRRLEWERLALRDRLRPEFHVFTGNDLAIDMVRYGSDWLLGLSTAWPEAFALRDRWWAAGDSRFDELDDALQALGDFAFRRPCRPTSTRWPRRSTSAACSPATSPIRRACGGPRPTGRSSRTIIARIERALAAAAARPLALWLILAGMLVAGSGGQPAHAATPAAASGSRSRPAAQRSLDHGR